MKKSQLFAKAAELLESGAVIVTGADVRSSGVLERAQVYFASDGEAVMDIISKDDLVQNFPDEGVYVPVCSPEGQGGEFRKVEMFEGAEDMYFRTDGTRDESDDFAGLPPVSFMETVEHLCSLKLKK